MSTNDPARLESRATDDRCIDERDERALQQYLTVLPETGRAHGADDLYLVVSESGSEYLVDTREQRCTCPDHEYREVRCKHLRRVAFATGARPVLDDLEGVDDQLGTHVPDGGAARPVATDGGTVVGAETADVPDERPDDCECRGADDVCACWPCYAAGFAFDHPNPDAEPEDTDTAGESA